MYIEKQVTYQFDFPDDDIRRIVKALRNKYDKSKARTLVMEVVSGWDDCDYYAWDSDETEQVLAEIEKRLKLA